MPQGHKPSRAQLATFWHFARCDYLAAYINHSSTRLDTADASLWRSAGLLIDDRGMIVPGGAEPGDSPREDMIANALVFIISKLMNLLVPSSKARPNDLNRWEALQLELDIWFESLPDSFTRCWRLDVDSASADPARTHFAEVYYSIPLCSVTMQQYHFARILILLYAPSEASASVRNRLRNNSEIPIKITHHSREICAIALGQPPGYARIHMQQPLFVAGQCLEDPIERNVILELLRDIETDLGWTTDYQVNSLRKEWGWEGNMSER
jgi:hypothetical protein